MAVQLSSLGLLWRSFSSRGAAVGGAGDAERVSLTPAGVGLFSVAAGMYPRGAEEQKPVNRCNRPDPGSHPSGCSKYGILLAVRQWLDTTSLSGTFNLGGYLRHINN